MPLFLLSNAAYRGELAQVGERGCEYTHLASLRIDQASAPIRAFVKAYPLAYTDGRPARGLVNEVVGYFCAERAGMPVPPSAGLIVLHPSQLTDPPDWIVPGEPLVAWWTEDVGFRSVKATWDFDALPAGSAVWRTALAEVAEFLMQSALTPAIVALDDLTANVDRNLGNLLVGNDSLTLIDHGQVLTGPAWVTSDLVIDASFNNKVRNILAAAAETLPFKGSVMAEYSSLITKLAPNLPELRRLLDQLVGSADAGAVHTFLAGRAVSSTVAKRVGVVA